jgi:hypothetical protein
VSIFSRKSSDQDPDDRFSEDRRPLRWIALALLSLVVVCGAWLGFQALSAKSSLEKARESAQQVKDALIDGKTDEAAQKAQTALAQAQSARSTTHSGLWNVAAGLPFVGGPFKTGQQISDVVVGLSSDILQPAANAGIGFSPSKLYENGRVNVQLLRQQEPELVRLSDSAARLDAQAAAIGPAGFVAPLNTARTQLQNQTSEIASLLNNTTVAARIGPSIMGADGPRTYLMVFQTNAEARGTGGLLGGFGVLRFDNGKPTIDDVTPNTELAKATADVDLGPEFNELYGQSRPYSDFRNSNQSAHFPYAAQIWRSMWERQTNVNVDGVIALDPVALSYILGAIGSVKAPDGQVVTKDNVIELTMSTAYIKFPEDQEARKEYLQGIAVAVAKKMTGEVKSPGKLLDALGQAVSERRIMMWSAFPAEQEVLAETALGHVIPDDDAPFAQVIINNLGGNKMDYYLKREIEYVADSCDGDVRNSTVTVRLTNTMSGADLPEYVAGGMGLPSDLPIKVPPGTMVSSVRLLATKGATLQNVTSNGERIVPNIETVERGRPSFEVQVAIPPGQSGELTFQLEEPTAPGAPRFPMQPLIDQPRPKLSVAQCS